MYNTNKNTKKSLQINTAWNIIKWSFIEVMPISEKAKDFEIKLGDRMDKRKNSM